MRRPTWAGSKAQAPGAVKRLVGRCLEKRPEDRFQTANDLALALDVLGRGEEWAGPASSANRVMEESGPATSAAPVRSRRRLWPVAGLAGLLAMAAAAWLLLRPPLPPPRVVPLTSLRGNERAPSLLAGRRAGRVQSGTARSWTTSTSTSSMIGSSEVRRLTTDPAPDLVPSWSPDGRQIAFTRVRTAGGRRHPTRFAPGRVRPQAGRSLATWVRRRGLPTVVGWPWRAPVPAGCRRRVGRSRACPSPTGSSSSPWRAASLAASRSLRRPARLLPQRFLRTDATWPMSPAPASSCHVDVVELGRRFRSRRDRPDA